MSWLRDRDDREKDEATELAEDRVIALLAILRKVKDQWPDAGYNPKLREEICQALGEG